MQDNYTGDIGDYGKYGLLRAVCAEGLSLAVNWYRVIPKKSAKQEDGKYIDYLTIPEQYRTYDPVLYDTLYKIVWIDRQRKIQRIEQENLFPAIYYSKEISKDRSTWHKQALMQAVGADVVFLDPDNGLETAKMCRTDGATEKHVKWCELRDYYAGGHNVILYQHRPQMISKEKCVESIMQFQREYLFADCVKLLEFPKYTNRFYFMFVHADSVSAFDQICRCMVQQWGENGFCREIVLQEG